MPRPRLRPILDPRQPHRALSWTMRTLREANGWTGQRLAEAYGCDPAHISRVETGQHKPSRMLVLYYEEVFDAEGLLTSQLEVAEYAAEQERRRWKGKHPRRYRALPGDASEFISQSVPHGALMQPGWGFEASWQVQNSGSVPWIGRRLERQGPVHGPGLITSSRFVDLPDTAPGKKVTISTWLRAPTYDCSSIAYFKMVDAEGKLCFPDSYQLGLDVLVMVSGQKPDDPSEIDTDEYHPD